MSTWTNQLRLTLDSAAVEAGLRRVMSMASRTTAAVGGIASAATRAGGAMAGAFKGMGDMLWKLPDQARALTGILQSLSLPSTLAGSAETTAVAFRVLVGDAGKAGELLERIRTLAATTPFEFPELANAARKLAAFGEEAGAIPETLKRIGDVAAGTQSDINELALIYGKARVAGTLYAEDINQLLERGIPVLDLFAAQTGRSAAEVKQLASEGKVTFPMLEQAFRALTGEGGKFAGMMGEIATTFEGKMSTLSDSFKGLMGKLGEGVNEGLKPVFDELTTLLDGQQGKAAEIGRSIGEGIEVALEVLKGEDRWQVMGTQLEALAWEFGAVMSRALEQAIRVFAEGLVSTMDLVLPDAVTENAKAGIDEFFSSMDGSDYLNEKAQQARESANQMTQEAQRRVENRRDAARNEKMQKEHAAGAAKYYGEQAAAEQNMQSEAEYANSQANMAGKTEFRYGGGLSAGAGAGTGGAGTGAGSAGGGGGGGGGGGAPAFGNAPALDMSGMVPLGGQTPAEQFNEMVGPQQPARRPLGTGTQQGRGMGTEEFRKRFGDGGRASSFRGLDSDFLGMGGAPVRADRMAGMVNGQSNTASQQNADLTGKAAALALKLLPEIDKNLRRTATNTGNS